MPHAGELWGLEQGDGEPLHLVLLTTDGAILRTDTNVVLEAQGDD